MINKSHSFSSGTGWGYQLERYLAALAAAVSPFVILSTYLFYRRGYYDLYIANKIFSETAALLLGVILLIGPLNRLFSFPSRYVGFRKELGIVAFFLAFIHIVASSFFLRSKFPLTDFSGILKWPSYFGFMAAVILIAIFLISNNRAIVAIGKVKWRQMQSWGIRVLFAFIVLHVFVMKWDSWVSWYGKGGAKDLIRPEWPGGGLLIGWFMAFVAFVRLAEFISPKAGRLAWRIGAIALPIAYIATFWWGSRFAR